MGQIYSQQGQQGVWTVVGPPSACALQLAQPLAISYADGSSDTLPAHTPGLGPGGTTQVDRTSAVWIGYLLKGDATLRMVTEQALAALGTDYVPLCRLLSDRVVPYQPQQPGGEAFAAGSWSGGAIRSSGSRSMVGAAASSTDLPVGIGGARPVTDVQAWGVFLKMLAAPATPTILVDLYKSGSGGGTGYWRLSIDGSLQLKAEIGLVAYSPNNAMGTQISAPILTNKWYWIEVDQGDTSRLVLWVQASDAASPTPYSGPTGNPNGASMALQLGWGQSLSAPGTYVDFPNDPTKGQMSKLQLVYGHANAIQIAMPSGDPGSGIAWYPCRQALGAAASILDGSTSHHDLSAASAGATIESDGPFLL